MYTGHHPGGEGAAARGGLVGIATLGAKGLDRASQLWEVGRVLIQVGQRDCVLLTDWPVKLGLESWTLIVREGQGEEGLRFAHKLVHVTLASHLWGEKGWVGLVLPPGQSRGGEHSPSLHPGRCVGYISLPCWFF